MGRCGKRLIKEWVYVAPDGTETVMKDLTSAVQEVALHGGRYYKRTERR